MRTQVTNYLEGTETRNVKYSVPSPFSEKACMCGGGGVGLERGDNSSLNLQNEFTNEYM